MNHICIDILNKIITFGFECNDYDDTANMLELKTVNKTWAKVIKAEFKRYLRCMLDFEHNYIINSMTSIMKCDYIIKCYGVDNIDSVGDIISSINCIYGYHYNIIKGGATMIINFSKHATNESIIYSINIENNVVHLFQLIGAIDACTLYKLLNKSDDLYAMRQIKCIVNKLINMKK